MKYKYLRTAAILVQSLYCLAIFIGGIVTGVKFFSTFIGPALLLAIIAFMPRFYYDVVAMATMMLMVLIAFLFSAAASLFNHEFGLAFAALVIPVTCLATLIYCMDKLKKQDTAYS